MKKFLLLFLLLIFGTTLIGTSGVLGNAIAWNEINDTCYTTNKDMYDTDCVKNLDELVAENYDDAVNRYYNMQQTTSQILMSFGEVISIISAVGILILKNNKKVK